MSVSICSVLAWLSVRETRWQVQYGKSKPPAGSAPRGQDSGMYPQPVIDILIFELLEDLPPASRQQL